MTNSFNGNLISAFDYINDEIGRRTARLDALPGAVATTNVFGYNTRSEVISANMGTNTYGYVFDPIGSRITATNNAEGTAYSANELNQYTIISNTVRVLPVHDDDGNMLTNGVWSYVWDGENRLCSVLSNKVLFATYTYDHQFRRVGKITDGTTRSFVYDGWNMIQESQYSSIPSFHSSTNSYVWGLDLSETLQGVGGVGGLLSIVQDGEVSYPSFDANGNVTECTDTSGTVIAHYEFSPFGETVVQSGTRANTFGFRYSTKYREEESGFYYYGLRYFVPEIGRWLNRDPIGNFLAGVNEYPFVANNPCNQNDILGLITPEEKCTKTVADAYGKDPQIRQLLADMSKRAGMKNCDEPLVVCSCCENKKRGGVYHRDDHSIEICYNHEPAPSEDYLKGVFRHEMDHAVQECYDENQDDDCKTSVCREIEAYYKYTYSYLTNEEARKKAVLKGVLASSSAWCPTFLGIGRTKKIIKIFEELYDECSKKTR